MAGDVFSQPQVGVAFSVGHLSCKLPGEHLSPSCVQFSMPRCTSGSEVSLLGLSQALTLLFPLQILLSEQPRSCCVTLGGLQPVLL